MLLSKLNLKAKMSLYLMENGIKNVIQKRLSGTWNAKRTLVCSTFLSRNLKDKIGGIHLFRVILQLIPKKWNQRILSYQTSMAIQDQLLKKWCLT